ncbi:Uncharacterized protein Fot_20441 [Forsythia ovata]|uniref:Uncharacterized protein n=1 Tax=Forsythia ovata TaxID=205694 RepID=A0ABD1UTI3_9LAMI
MDFSCALVSLSKGEFPDKGLFASVNIKAIGLPHCSRLHNCQSPSGILSQYYIRTIVSHKSINLLVVDFQFQSALGMAIKVIENSRTKMDMWSKDALLISEESRMDIRCRTNGSVHFATLGKSELQAYKADLKSCLVVNAPLLYRAASQVPSSVLKYAINGMNLIFPSNSVSK